MTQGNLKPINLTEATHERHIFYNIYLSLSTDKSNFTKINLFNTKKYIIIVRPFFTRLIFYQKFAFQIEQNKLGTFLLTKRWKLPCRFYRVENMGIPINRTDYAGKVSYQNIFPQKYKSKYSKVHLAPHQQNFGVKMTLTDRSLLGALKFKISQVFRFLGSLQFCYNFSNFGQKKMHFLHLSE